MVQKAVVLAAGRGTRMQRGDGSWELTEEQARAADAGSKAMMPFERPFLDFVLSALADAGFTDVCIVVSRDDRMIRTRYTRDAVPARFRLEFAEQAAPRGTADAVRASRSFAGDDVVVTLNADNYYTPSVLRATREIGGAGLPAFARSALTARGNIPAERINAFALLDVDASGHLRDIVEKPDAATAARFGEKALVSMNVWSFTPAIFDACDRVTPSARGELEIADAVRIAIEQLGVVFTAIPVSEGVLDLSSRADVAAVAARLAGVSVAL